MQNRASLLVLFVWLAMALAYGVPSARAEDAKPNPCTEDAMLVFDASGSMSGPVLPGNGGTVSRIDWARAALAEGGWNNALVPAGHTPLTAGVKQAADALDYTAKPGVIVVLTDGEETCGGSPCEIGKSLAALGKHLTVHVIAYRPGVVSWMGEQSIGEAKCLADQTGGLYITAKTQDDLVQALEKTLDCPMTSELTR